MGNRLKNQTLGVCEPQKWDQAYFKLTAEKERSKRVWSSFGAWHWLLNFLEPWQCLELQAANRFCYTVAVSRVIMKVSVLCPIYLTLADSEANKIQNETTN